MNSTDDLRPTIGIMDGLMGQTGYKTVKFRAEYPDGSVSESDWATLMPDKIRVLWKVNHARLPNATVSVIYQVDEEVDWQALLDTPIEVIP